MFDVKVNKKIISLISIGIIVGLLVLYLSTVDSVDKKFLSENFSLDAIYDDELKTVTINFSDKTEKTTVVVMEILGMDETYQKTFVGHNFVVIINFDSIPKYGWKIHPVTLVVNHSDLGEFGMKTEIHELDDIKPRVIFSDI